MILAMIIIIIINTLIDTNALGQRPLLKSYVQDFNPLKARHAPNYNVIILIIFMLVSGLLERKK